jgi:hypothetical protein
MEGLATDWRELDPLMVGVWRMVGAGQDRLRVRAEVAPLVPEKYGWIAKQLGPPSRTAIQFADDDLIHIQAHVTTDFFGGTIPPHHLFAAIKDVQPPPLDQLQELLQTYFFLRGAPGYLGAWPRPGVLDRLPLGLGRGQPAGNNMTRLLGGLYRWQANGFSVVSFLPDILAASAPQLRTTQADDSAQVRLHVGNLVGSRLESWANNQLHERALLASMAGADFLSAISDQLRVPAGSAPEAAQKLLQGTISDPLGGEFVLVADAPGLPPRWRGSTWPKVPKLATEAPAGYQAPLLRWFRGAEIKLMQDADRLILSGEIRMQQR